MNHVSGLHAAAWLVVYTSAIVAALLSALLARGAADKPLRRLAASEAYAVAVISLAYVFDALGLSAALPAPGADLFSALVNGTLLHALALIALSLHPFAASLGGPVAVSRKAMRGLDGAGRIAAGLLGAGFGLATFLGAGPLSSDAVKAIAVAPLAIVAVGLTASVVASAWRVVASAWRVVASRDRAARVVAVAGAAAYAAFIAFELSPQFMASRPHASPPTYFALAAFFAILNGGLIALLLPRIGRAPATAPSPGSAAIAAESPSEQRMLEAGLSAREREVASLLAEGASYKDIGERLFVSMSTVQTHVTRVYAKLGVSSKVELANALRRGEGIV